jgi:hypothetical protein
VLEAKLVTFVRIYRTVVLFSLALLKWLHDKALEVLELDKEKNLFWRYFLFASILMMVYSLFALLFDSSIKDAADWVRNSTSTK